MRWPPELSAGLCDGYVGIDIYTSDRAAELFSAIDAAPVWEHVLGTAPTDAGDLDAHVTAQVTGGRRLTFVVTRWRLVVGMTSIDFDPDDPTGVEIGGTLMSPDVWGSGVNTRAKNLLIGWLSGLGAAWIQFRTDERNDRSWRPSGSSVP